MHLASKYGHVWLKKFKWKIKTRVRRPKSQTWGFKTVNHKPTGGRHAGYAHFFYTVYVCGAVREHVLTEQAYR